MKKLTGILILCGLIILASLSAAASDITGHLHEDAVKMLSDFQIMNGYPDGTYRPDASITRAEFAALTVRFAGMEESANGYYGANSFYDVSQSDWYSEYAAFCKSMGFIDGYSDGSFGGNDSITSKQAVKIVLSVLGYKNIAESSGGYPDGYLKLAYENGLLKGVTAGDTSATRGEIARLLVNALDTKIADETYTTGSKEYYITDTTQIENLGYVKYTGYVDAVYSLSADNGLSVEAEDEIIIGGNKYLLLSKSDPAEFFGLEVDFYVKEERGGNADEIYHIALAKNDKSISVDAGDILDSTTLSVFRYNNGSGNKSVNLSAPLIIYNGKVLTTAQMTDSVLKIGNGSVTLLDSDSDGNYEKILVWEYSALVVRSVSEDAIYAELSRNVAIPEEDDRDGAVVVYKNGKKCTLADIVKGDVISAYASKDGKYVRIVADGAKVEGTVTATAQQDGKNEFDLDNGRTYTTESYYQSLINSDSSRIDIPEPGDNVVLYLDSYGRIAFSELVLDNSGLRYGYLIDSAVDGGISGTVWIKYLNDSNEIIEAQVGRNNSVRAGYVDGSSYIVKRMKSDEFYEKLAPEGSTAKQMIKYVADEEGIISELYLVDVESYGDIWGECDETTKSRTYAGNLFGQNYIVDQYTKIFYIPTNSAENVYRSGNAMAYLVYNKGYSAYVYDVDNLHVGCLLIRETVASSGGYKYIIDVTNDDFMLIEASRHVTNEDGNTQLQLSGWIEGEQATVLVSDTLEKNSEPISGLTKGKLIQFKTNASIRKAAESADEPLQMILYETRCDFTSENNDEILWELVGISQDNSKLRTILGTISYRDENLVKINVSGTEYPIVVSDYARIVAYDVEENTGKLVSVEEMNEGKRVYVRQRYNNVIEVFILE